jgi:C-8 sterol isomerase
MGVKQKVAPPPSSSGLTKWVTWITAIIGIIYLCQYLDEIKDQWYIFNTEKLHILAKDAVAKHGNDTSAMVSFISQNLTQEYSLKHINPRVEEWVFNNAGGAMGAMYVIHASITEYLIIFGTAIGTEGHTGRHTADDYFHILTGEQWAFAPPNLEMEVYPAGSVHHLKRGAIKQYKMHKGCFALEYARGWIPLMLPFGFADMLTSTLDFQTMYDTARITGREMIRNLIAGKI